ncbi:MAG: guanylate cyclase [Eggerthellaceae bacterium]|jgi:predicted neutral ceramidase superfamily lipid hydrolase
MFARLSRLIPFLLIIGFIALIIYLVVMFRYSSTRAKEILIKIFTWLNIVLSAFFVLASLYALLDNNMVVLELNLSFLVVFLLALLITRICRRVFLKHHPNYRTKPLKTEEVKNKGPFNWFR